VDYHAIDSPAPALDETGVEGDAFYACLHKDAVEYSSSAGVVERGDRYLGLQGKIHHEDTCFQNILNSTVSL